MTQEARCWGQGFETISKSLETIFTKGMAVIMTQDWGMDDCYTWGPALFGQRECTSNIMHCATSVQSSRKCFSVRASGLKCVISRKFLDKDGL